MSGNMFTMNKRDLEEVSKAVIENGPGVLAVYASHAGKDQEESIRAFKAMVNTARVGHLAIALHQDSMIETDGKAAATLAQLHILAEKVGVRMDLPVTLERELESLPRALSADFFFDQLETSPAASRASASSSPDM